MGDLLLVVPCYNEAARLDSAAYQQFASCAARVRLLFVNDGSTDSTEEVLTDLVETNPQSFSLCSLPNNAGKAEAVRYGMQQALRESPAYVGYWDADLSTPLSAVPQFLDILDAKPAVQAVIGSRVRLLGRSIQRVAWRHYTGRIFATMASVTLRLQIYDTQCGAKVFRASDLLESILAEPFRTRWIFDVEILSRLLDRLGPSGEESIYEVPLSKWNDITGSKLRARDFLIALLDLGLLYTRRRTGGSASAGRALGEVVSPPYR